MQIKKIDLSMIDQIFKISNQQFGQESYSFDQIKDMISDGNYNSMSVLLNNKIVSYVITIETLDDVNIISIATENNYKKNGFATTLINWYKQYAKNNNKTLSLEVKSKNKPAINLYTKLGFKTIHQRKNYYKDGDDALIMFCEM